MIVTLIHVGQQTQFLVELESNFFFIDHYIYVGKFGAVFASIPAPIVAALYCLFFAYGMYYQFKEVGVLILIFHSKYYLHTFFSFSFSC